MWIPLCVSGPGGSRAEGLGAGVAGADRATVALYRAGRAKVWRAFLSATVGEDGDSVNAIERVGEGPWYDRLGRLVAEAPADLAQTRPNGADAAIVNDLPNEEGVPNHQPDPGVPEVDNHDTLTGSDAVGSLYANDLGVTCDDWTSAT